MLYLLKEKLLKTDWDVSEYSSCQAQVSKQKSHQSFRTKNIDTTWLARFLQWEFLKSFTVLELQLHACCFYTIQSQQLPPTMQDSKIWTRVQSDSAPLKLRKIKAGLTFLEPALFFFFLCCTQSSSYLTFPACKSQHVSSSLRLTLYNEFEENAKTVKLYFQFWACNRVPALPLNILLCSVPHQHSDTLLFLYSFALRALLPSLIRALWLPGQSG